MAEDFVISGTGQVVRPGDRIVVRATTLSGHSGSGILARVLTPVAVMVRYDHAPDAEEFTFVTRLMREDDEERASGSPLWYWR